MANISISDLYQGEGLGKKYGGILSAVLHEIIRNGIPEGCDERTWIELLTVKHTFLIAKQMAEQGDAVSELTDAAPPFCISERIDPKCSGALLCISSGSQICGAEACRFGSSLNCALPAQHGTEKEEKA